MSETKSKSDLKNRNFNPVIATIIVAIIGFLGTTIATIINNSNSTKLESRKFEYELIKKGLEQPSEEEKVKYFKFLLNLKLIQNNEVRIAMENFLKDPKSLPQLPGNFLLCNACEGKGVLSDGKICNFCLGFGYFRSK